MMKPIKGVITILLTLMLTCPMILSNVYAEKISEGNAKAYLMVALPENLALSQLDKTSLINLSDGGLDRLPINGAKNMSYNKAVKSVESGKLNNKALLFVYAPGLKGKAVQGSASTGDEATKETNLFISRILNFIRSLLGLGAPEEEAPIEDSGDEQGIGFMPPPEEETTPAPEEDTAIAPEEETAPVPEEEISEGIVSLFPPLEQPTEQPEETEEENVAEEPGQTDEISAEQPGEIEEVAGEEPSETEEVAGEEQPEETEEVAEEEQPSETEEVIGAEQPGGTEEVADNESGATVIPVQPVNPGNEDTEEFTPMTPMALQNLGKALHQMGYRYTIIPFN